MSARTVAIALAVLLLAACAPGGELVDAGPAPRRAAPTPPASSAPATPRADETTARSPTPREPAPPTPAGDTEAPGLTMVTIALVRDDAVESVRRTVPRVPRIGAAALRALLDGPNPAEAEAGYRTEVPDGTRLRSLTITDGVALVDLSREFETGGEPTALTLRTAQVVCTLDAFPTVDGVRIAVDGEIITVVVGDGEVVDEPVVCDDYAQLT